MVLTSSSPELGVPLSSRLTFDVIANTTGRPGLISANVGGDFPIDITATPGASSDSTVATFASAASATSVGGQTEGFPQIATTVPANAPHGSIATAPITFTAINSQAGDPAVVNPTQSSTATVTVLKPTTGIDENGLPLGTTVFLAVQGFGADPAINNEFLNTDLATFVAAHLGQDVEASLDNISLLLDPATDLEDILTVDPLRLSFPQTEAEYINVPGAPGTDDLVTTVLNSAKIASGSTAYDSSLNAAQTAVKAIEIAIPETFTKNGTFSASEFLFFANDRGDVFNQRSGLSRVTTDRTFELALIDTNTKFTGIESGDADDFGLIVEVGRIGAGASVVTGQFVFLSYTGGLEGEDIDTVDVPGINATNAILLDLDNLYDALGCETITRLFIIDADVGGTVNIMEVLSLNRACTVDADCHDGNPCTDDVCNAAGTCDFLNNTAACDDGDPCTIADTCAGGVCQSGVPPDCSGAGDQCNTASCDPNGAEGNCNTLTPVADGTPCDDDLFCSATDTCSGGVCVGSGDPCAGQLCDETNDACVDCFTDLDCPQGTFCNAGRCTPIAIPTVSEWGMIVMTLLLLTGGTIVLGRRRGAMA